jgi:predicted aspartyl protease
LHLIYSLSSGPYRGTYEEWNTPDGRHRVVTDIPGVFHRDAAYDGVRAWIVDLSGVPHPLSGADRARLITESKQGSLLFSHQASGTVTPAGGIPLTIEADASGRPVREELHPTCGLVEVEKLTEWSKAASVEVPHRIERPEDVLTFQSAAMEEVTFEPPAIHSPLKRRSVVIPFETQAFHIFVPVRVNGGTRQWFVIDTGADLSFVTHGLRAAKSIETSGSGGSVQAGLAPNADLQLGDVNIPLKVIGIAPQSGFSELWGRSFDGVAGYDVIGRFVIRIDWTHRTLKLYDPRHFEYRGVGAVVPLRFAGNNIVIPVAVTLPDGTKKEIESVIDTGSSGALSFRSSFSPDVGKTITALGHGVGGTSKTSIGRIRALTIGPYTLHEPVVELSHAQRGTEAGCTVPASIGERVLSRFTLYLDYAHERLILEPNAHLDDPFENDMSGLDLAAAGPRFRHLKIVAVRDASAGAQARLQAGDEIVAAGGTRISGRDVSRLQERFRRQSDIRLTIARAGKTLHVTLHLHREV